MTTLEKMLVDYQPTHLGASFLISDSSKKVNLSYIVRRLEKCSIRNGDCEVTIDESGKEKYTCSDLGICLRAYDDRCHQGEITCSTCGESVPRNKICSECGAVMKGLLEDKP